MPIFQDRGFIIPWGDQYSMPNRDAMLDLLPWRWRAALYLDVLRRDEEDDSGTSDLQSSASLQPACQASRSVGEDAKRAVGNLISYLSAVLEHGDQLSNAEESPWV